ncbi:ABC transporter substrate-binding protein [Amorphus orientalis]|uniref:Multiple sugar transport system substrate-binding protein n=1 Tax=Amorphus orientalis TaxID=649198 RepID=A0AAE3VNS4_9HYPH|nr:extracellular solute-binding protein [Amorphus orientalis]MDQ0315350.1 multiple sugar transport system substrate-binding protein [Amorphus orientalis]
MKRLMTAACALAMGLGVSAAEAQEGELTLCWAAWDPANALQELGKDFTQKTGIEMNYEFVPWTSFADRFLNELNSQGKLCDLMIGDSQWLGLGAEFGHYVQLNDFFEQEGISMDDFLPAGVYNYATWPKGSENYWALPAMGDAVGYVYRKDWFAMPEIREAFQAEYGRELAPPETWDELLETAKFFQGREIDGQTRYGIALYTERGSEGITMGVTNALYAWDVEYDNPDQPYEMEGYFNSEAAVEALEAYKELYECCTPPGHSDAYMVDNLDAYKSGQTAMQMNFFAFFPGIAKDEAVGGEVSGFFVNPSAKTEASVLGGQGISVVSYSDNKDDALEYIKWFAQPDVQQRWWDLGGYSVHKAVLEDPGFVDSQPFAGQFLEAMSNVRDFWQEPTYAELLQSMQRHMHDYIVADQGTAQEALDATIEDWDFTFESVGKK